MNVSHRKGTEKREGSGSILHHLELGGTKICNLLGAGGKGEKDGRELIVILRGQRL